MYKERHLDHGSTANPARHYVESSSVVLSLPTVWVMSHQHLILDVENHGQVYRGTILAEQNA
jgi:hypothetical protein